MEIKATGSGVEGLKATAGKAEQGVAGNRRGSFAAMLVSRLTGSGAAEPVGGDVPTVHRLPDDLARLKGELLRNGPEKTAAPGPPPAAPAALAPIEYTVRPGDTLWKIGRQHAKADPFQIARDNGIADPNRIRPGQKLLIYPPSPRPAPPPISAEVTASWYGADHHTKTTASGQPFDMYQNTLAHKTLPLGTKVRLVNPANGRVAEGVVNDRGPYVQGRDVDVSYALAERLGFVRKGVTTLKIETLKG